MEEEGRKDPGKVILQYQRDIYGGGGGGGEEEEEGWKAIDA